jgi:hypothetical protein
MSAFMLSIHCIHATLSLFGSLGLHGIMIDTSTED